MIFRGTNKAALAEGLLIGLLLSLAILAINQNWFFTNPFIPPWFDPFVYQGLFMHPREYVGAYSGYYATTRTPYIAIGAAFYAVLPPVAANIALKVTLYTLTVGLFYATARLLAARSAALPAAIMLATYPFFIMSLGWDYVDGAINLLSAACYFAAAHGARQYTRWPLGEFAAGVVFAMLIACNLFAITLGPSILLFYFAMLYSADGHSAGRAALLRRIVAALLGVTAGLVVHALAFRMSGGDTLLPVLTQFRAVTRASAEESSKWTFQNWSFLLHRATWLALPLAVAIISTITSAIALRRIVRRSFGKQDVFMVLINAQYLLLLTFYCVFTVLSVPVLMFWFYASYLNIPGLLTTAYAFTYVGRERGGAGWIWLLAAFPLLAIHWPSLGRPLQQLLGFRYEQVRLITALALVVVALGAITAAPLARLRSVAATGVLLLSIGYVSMITISQLNYLHLGDRMQGFLAVIAAGEERRSVSADPRHFLWIDRGEPNYYGGLFGAVAIQSFLAAKRPGPRLDQTTRFPALPAHGFQAGDPVVILTARPDWRRAADENLRTIDLALGPARVRTIAYGDVRFEAIVARLVPIPR
jgi:hypothetical protein